MPANRRHGLHGPATESRLVGIVFLPVGASFCGLLPGALRSRSLARAKRNARQGPGHLTRSPSQPDGLRRNGKGPKVPETGPEREPAPGCLERAGGACSQHPRINSLAARADGHEPGRPGHGDLRAQLGAEHNLLRT